MIKVILGGEFGYFHFFTFYPRFLPFRSTEGGAIFAHLPIIQREHIQPAKKSRPMMAARCARLLVCFVLMYVIISLNLAGRAQVAAAAKERHAVRKQGGLQR